MYTAVSLLVVALVQALRNYQPSAPTKHSIGHVLSSIYNLDSSVSTLHSIGHMLLLSRPHLISTMHSIGQVLLSPRYDLAQFSCNPTYTCIYSLDVYIKTNGKTKNLTRWYSSIYKQKGNRHLNFDFKIICLIRFLLPSSFVFNISLNLCFEI